MAYEGELSPAIEVAPGETVSIVIGAGDHAALDAAVASFSDATLDAGQLGFDPENDAVVPAGTTVDGPGYMRTTWAGTVAADVDPAGPYRLTPGIDRDGYGELSSWWTIPIVISVPVVTIPRPNEPTWNDEELSYTLADEDGVTWLIDDTEQEPGTYTAEQGTTITVQAVPAVGYTFGDGDEPSVFTHVFPVPPPNPDEWPTEVTPGGLLVARWLGWDTEDERREASYFYFIVSNFVEGYTRGRGFDTNGVPTRPLQNVIVSATARLARNPENISRYQVDTYSENRAVFEGFNIAEKGILHNYRRRQA